MKKFPHQIYVKRSETSFLGKYFLKIISEGINGGEYFEFDHCDEFLTGWYKNGEKFVSVNLENFQKPYGSGEINVCE